MPHWEEVPDLVEVRDIHLDSFKAVREAQVETFAQVAHEAWGGPIFVFAFWSGG